MEAAQQREAQRLLHHQLAQPQERQQRQLPTVEEIISNAPLPERAKAWLRDHPEYITDPERNARLQEMHHVAKYHAGEEYTDSYFDKMEALLGLGSPDVSITVENEHSREQSPQDMMEQPTMTAPPPRRQISVPQFASERSTPAAPPPRSHPQHVPPVSAPPHREVPMRNGRRL